VNVWLIVEYELAALS